MTDTQLYFAVGIPSALFALNLIMILWHSRGLERLLGAKFDLLSGKIDGLDASLNGRIDALKEIMNARFDAAQQGLLRVEGVLDARLKHLEEREK